MEWSKNNGYDAKAFDSVYEANEYPADCYIFDISAVSPMNFGNHAYAPICRLIEDHPGAEIIIGSCISRNAVEEVLDEVEKVSGRRPHFFDAASGFVGLEAAIEALNTQPSTAAKCRRKNRWKLK